ncbi:MAG: DUF433 domain-containing protein [Chloroflexota bacterium]
MEAIQHILIDDDGIPRTVNRRVKVKMIAEAHIDAGLNASDIAAEYKISLADVHAALTYYYDHQSWFAARDAENQKHLAEHGRKLDDLIGELRQRGHE